MYRLNPKPYCKAEDCMKIKASNCGGYCNDHKKLDPMYEDKLKKKEKTKVETKLRINFGTGSGFIQNDAAIKMQAQENWFRECAIEFAKDSRCQECGRQIMEKYFRAATAHILPKRKEYGFPSIATHPMNKFLLGAKFGACGCHDQYDSSWDAASKMKIWPMAVQIIVVELYPKIERIEHKNIPDILWVEIEKTHGSRT